MQPCQMRDVELLLADRSAATQVLSKITGERKPKKSNINMSNGRCEASAFEPTHMVTYDLVTYSSSSMRHSSALLIIYYDSEIMHRRKLEKYVKLLSMRCLASTDLSLV